MHRIQISTIHLWFNSISKSNSTNRSRITYPINRTQGHLIFEWQMNISLMPLKNLMKIFIEIDQSSTLVETLYMLEVTLDSLSSFQMKKKSNSKLPSGVYLSIVVTITTKTRRKLVVSMKIEKEKLLRLIGIGSNSQTSR